VAACVFFFGVGKGGGEETELNERETFNIFTII
jgi:hypothetical protein